MDLECLCLSEMSLAHYSFVFYQSMCAVFVLSRNYYYDREQKQATNDSCTLPRHTNEVVNEGGMNFSLPLTPKERCKNNPGP